MRRKEGDKGGDILRAAVRIFARDGFDAAKVSTIAELADVATGSVYLYYQGKDALLDALFHEFWTGLRDKIMGIAVIDPMERAQLQLEMFYDSLVADPDFGWIYLREHHRFLSRKPDGYEAFRDCLSLGEFAFQEASGTEVDPESLALSHAILFGGVRAALEHVLTRPECDTGSAKRHMSTMAMASLRALAKGGVK